MRRRVFIGALGGATIAWPLAASAQPPRKIARIGIFSILKTSDLVGPEPAAYNAKALLRGLRELGYAYGEHFVTEPRGSDGKVEQLGLLASELVREQVDVIVAAGPVLAALKQATSTIPIVMAGGEDPVGWGLTKSLAQPGTNFTGLSNQSVELMGKRLELLKELFPGPAPIAVLWDRAGLQTWQSAGSTARARDWQLLSLEVRDAGEIEPALAAAATAGACAIVTVGGLAFRHTGRIIELAARSRLPVMYVTRQQAEAGGLISYGPDFDEIWRRAGVFVYKILNGAKPADLPIEQPTKFELVINIKTANTLGLAVPPTLLARANEIIE